MARNFTRINRNGQQVWQRKDDPSIWVTHYPALDGVRGGVFYVYRAVAKVPAGRAPWTVDNRRVDASRGDRGISSLPKALAIAEAA
jgi:hypothetical protein